MEHQKAKSAAKTVVPKGPGLDAEVLRTAALIADVVGGTLGPGGRPVLIERPEYGLPPTVTKDGVTVFRALGFRPAVQHSILEAARDCAVRTAAEAGDGTTTATILFEALTRLTLQFCKKHPSWSPQRVVSQIQKAYHACMAPELEAMALRGDLLAPEGRRRLLAVAEVSANGDAELAAAVLECYDTCGDDGNVTLVEASGKRAYLVDKIDGYPIGIGYEHSCQRYASVFVNRTETQQAVLEKPAFVLNFGRVNDIQTLVPLLAKLQEAHEQGYLKTPNVVVVAIGFAETVLTSLATNWVSPHSINVLPLVVPNDSPLANAPRQFLDDLAAVTGAVVFDPLTHPVEEAAFEELGNLHQDFETANWVPRDVNQIEVGRYRSTVLGFVDEDLLVARVEVVKAQLQQAGSELETVLTQERLAKLTGGIAKLTIRGASNGEVKERRDRAEDAICAVRGAIKDGCLPGGCWALLALARRVHGAAPGAVVVEILYPALCAPFKVLLDNVGLLGDERQEVELAVQASANGDEPAAARVYNALTGQMCVADAAGLLDSLPAVRDALKNAVSIATLLGTLGGVIVQPRDNEVERVEARDAADFERNSHVNPADERP